MFSLKTLLCKQGPSQSVQTSTKALQLPPWVSLAPKDGSVTLRRIAVSVCQRLLTDADIQVFVCAQHHAYS